MVPESVTKEMSQNKEHAVADSPETVHVGAISQPLELSDSF